MGQKEKWKWDANKGSITTQMLWSLGYRWLLKECYKCDSEFPGSQHKGGSMVSC